MAITITTPADNIITVNETQQTVNVSTASSTITVETQGIASKAFSELTDVDTSIPYTAGHFVSVDENQKLVVSNVLSARTSVNRPVFEYYNSGSGPNAAVVLKKTYFGIDPTTGDGVGMRFEVDRDTGGFGYSEFAGGVEYATLMAVYSNTAPAFTMSSSINDGTSYQNILTANKDLVTIAGDIRVNGNSILDSTGARAIDFTTSVDGFPIIKFDRDRTYGLTASNMVLDSRVEMNTSQLTTTSINTVTLDQWNASTIRSGKYLIQISCGSEFQMWEGMMIHDGTASKITAYGDLRTGENNLAVVTSNYNSITGYVELKVTPTSATETKFRAMKTLIYV